LIKNGKKDSNLIDGSQRCEICGTTLTLYPKDFTACPHCHRQVCRQCWGDVWAGKSFAAESCSHITENDGRTMSSVGDVRKRLDWDWPKALIVLVLGGLAIGILFFLFNLFS
jgi:ribosomal protein S14